MEMPRDILNLALLERLRIFIAFSKVRIGENRTSKRTRVTSAAILMIVSSSPLSSVHNGLSGLQVAWSYPRSLIGYTNCG